MGKISEIINSMIARVLESAEWTSADPTHINTLIQINAEDNPDFETEIKQLVREGGDDIPSEAETQIKTQVKETKTIQDKLKAIDDSNLGEVQQFTSQQFGNIRQLANNPTGFIIQTFMKKFAKGVGVIAFALIIFEAVKWIIAELLKPGRMLDIRFKRDINKEIIAFRRREDQQKLRQGFSSIIITTTSSLRGGQGKIVNTLNMVGEREKFPDNTIGSGVILQASGVSPSKSIGSNPSVFIR